MRDFKFMASLYLAVCINIAGAEDVPRVSRSEIETIVRSGNLSAISALAERIETRWASTRHASYYKDMLSICEVLTDKPISSDQENALLQRLASQMLSKNDPGDKEGKSIVFLNQASLTMQLLEDRSRGYTNKLGPEKWAALRAHNTRLLMVFTRRIRDNLIEDYVPKPSFANVKPPINNSNEPLRSGMDPNDIRDPITRAAYEAARAENSRNNKENSAQDSLRHIISYHLMRIDESLVESYSREPLAISEINEFLMLGGYDAKARQKLLQAIADKSKSPLPLGLVPGTVRDK